MPAAARRARHVTTYAPGAARTVRMTSIGRIPWNPPPIETIEIAHEDVLHIPSGAEHEVKNTSDDFLGLLFINVPTGEGIEKLLAAKRQ